MKESTRLAKRFARMNSMEIKPVLEVNLRLAKLNGLRESLEEPMPTGIAFYLKLYILLHADEIRNSSGEIVLIGLDVSDGDAVRRRYEELGSDKNRLVRQQKYEEAARCRDQQKFLIRYMPFQD